MADKISFTIYCRKEIETIILQSYITFGEFRKILEARFDIYVSYQRFIGLRIDICDEYDRLNDVLGDEHYYFMLYGVGDDDSSGCPSEYAALQYIQYIEKHLKPEDVATKFITNLSFKDAILPPAASLPKGEVVILHFFKKGGKISELFLQNLFGSKKKNWLDHFCVFGWDITTSECHDAIWNSLEPLGLKTLDIKEMLFTENDALVFLTSDGKDIMVISSLRSRCSVTTQDLANSFQGVNNFIQILFQEESTDGNKLSSASDFQQFMYEQLGGKDYDKFYQNEHQLLKGKLAFAFYGPPTEVPQDAVATLSQTTSTENVNAVDPLLGYTERQKTWLEKVYEKIITHNNKYAQWNDEIVMAFLYNCAVPLEGPEVISPYPVFVLRKCEKTDSNGHPACRIFIDHKLRVYESWELYLENNKLPVCKMIVPEDGRYKGNPNTRKVLLDELESPACSLGEKILKVTDVSSTVASVGSGAVMGLSLIPAITFAPVVMIGAAVTGIGAGIYAIGRSSGVIHDRLVHDEDMSFLDSEARSAYLNIVAGSVGFISMGATAAVAKLAVSGRNIGQTGQLVLDSINLINIGASGVAVGNGIFETVNRAITDGEAPSLLTIVQLSSSILFFGNSVYNFKTASTIIQEHQVATLTKISENLKSNNQKKTFSKLHRETIRQSDGNAIQGNAKVISTMKNYDNPSELIASLQSSNKVLNEHNVRFSSSNGEILLNGVPVDVAEFSSMPKYEKTQYLSELPSMPNPEVGNIPRSYTSNTNNTVITMIKNEWYGIAVFGVKLILENKNTEQKIATILDELSIGVQRKVIEIAKELAVELQKSGDNSFIQFLNKINSKDDLIVWLVRCVLDFMEKLSFELPNFKYMKRVKKVFEMVIMNYQCGVAYWVSELRRFFVNWASKKIVEYCNEKKREALRRNENRPKVKQTCEKCSGYYYKSQ